jgi:hypothetical protein
MMLETQEGDTCRIVLTGFGEFGSEVVVVTDSVAADHASEAAFLSDLASNGSWNIPLEPVLVAFTRHRSTVSPHLAALESASRRPGFAMG